MGRVAPCVPRFCFQLGSDSGEALSPGAEMNVSCCLLIIFSYLPEQVKPADHVHHLESKGMSHGRCTLSKAYTPFLQLAWVTHRAPQEVLFNMLLLLCSQLSSGLCQCCLVLYSPLGTCFLVSRGNLDPEDLVYSLL